MEDYLEKDISFIQPASMVFNPESLHPILRHFVPSVTCTTAAFAKIDEMWQDSSADIFKIEVIER